MKFFSSGRKRTLHPRPHVVLVSHEASLTGAPKIALNLARQIREKTDADMTTLLHDGGPLHPEFSKISRTICLDLPREHHPKIHSTVRKIIKPIQNAGQEVICICNSVESRFVANSVYTRGVPILYLLHEYPTSYPQGEFEKIYEYSDKMVFPCESVRQAAHELFPVPFGKSKVLPQGLLDPEFGVGTSREKARKRIRRVLGIPEDSFVVLGCGTVDLRKGIDHFLAVARTHQSLNSETRPVYFCWVGDGPRHPHSAYHYVEVDLLKSNQRNVKMVGELQNVEPYFLGADCFLLTSRIDPFPCVIHEAMAARLPIMVFDQSGGAVEAIADGAGLTVPYGDYVGAADTIHRLTEQPDLARRLAAKAHQRVHQVYRFEDYADQIIQLCESEFKVRLSIDKPVSIPRKLAA